MKNPTMAARTRRRTVYKNRINKAGTLSFDHVYRGVGRIRRASGTNDVKLFHRYKAMLDELYESGRLQILRDIKDKHISVIEVFERYRDGTLNMIPDIKAVRPIRPSVDDFIATYPKWSDGTRTSYAYQYNNFLRVISPTTQIIDLPQALENYYRHCLDSDTPRKFNYLKDIISRYVRATFGKETELYRQCREVEGFSNKRRRQGRPLRPRKLFELINRLPNPYAHIACSMAFTGMGPKELYSDGWEYDSEYSIRIHGQKRDARDRRIPRILDPTKPERRIDGLREQLKKLTEGKTQPYDLRRSYTLMLEASGIPQSRINSYMGWSERGLKDLYTSHEVEQYLKEDLELLRTHLLREQIDFNPDIQFIKLFDR